PGGAAPGAVPDGEIRFTIASVSNVNGTVSGGRAQITTGQAAFERVEATQGAINGIALRDVSATIGSGANGMSGFINLEVGNWNNTKLGPRAAAFAASRDTISLSGFKVSAFGGGATGDLTVELAPNGASKLRADFTGLQTAELFALFGAQCRDATSCVS